VMHAGGREDVERYSTANVVGSLASAFCHVHPGLRDMGVPSVFPWALWSEVSGRFA
jgi:hypothetical protein